MIALVTIPEAILAIFALLLIAVVVAERWNERTRRASDRLYAERTGR